MEIQTESFVIHDLSRFPLVWARAGVTAPGYAGQWEREMVALLSIAKPFVMIYGESPDEETHEDRKQRGLWLKHNKAVLTQYCKVMIGIEPDPLKMVTLKAQFEMATKAFGIPGDVVETEDEAVALAHHLLGPQSALAESDIHGH